jgi:cytochrome c
MRCSTDLALLMVVVIAGCSAAGAQMPDYRHVGRTPTPLEIRGLNISVLPDGEGLPPGSGTAKQGAVIFARDCAYCHGPTGEEGPAPPFSKDAKTCPVATTIWDFIRRAMPLDRGGSLSADEVYALTAFVLYRNGIIMENALMNAKTLLKVKMPNRNGFYPSPTKGGWDPRAARPYGIYH